MAISNELSGDIASELLAAHRFSGIRRQDLKEMVLLVHSTLQQLSRQTTNPSSPEGSEEGRKLATDFR